ncbi:MAG: antitoxin VapB family protein [Candidatus Woesearchaeota archaeon]
MTLTDEAYDLLRDERLPGESFSDTIRRTYADPKPEDFFSSWDKEFADEVEEAIGKRRSKKRERPSDHFPSRTR